MLIREDLRGEPGSKRRRQGARAGATVPPPREIAAHSAASSSRVSVGRAVTNPAGRFRGRSRRPLPPCFSRRWKGSPAGEGDEPPQPHERPPAPIRAGETSAERSGATAKSPTEGTRIFSWVRIGHVRGRRARLVACYQGTRSYPSAATGGQADVMATPAAKSRYSGRAWPCRPKKRTRRSGDDGRVKSAQRRRRRWMSRAGNRRSRQRRRAREVLRWRIPNPPMGSESRRASRERSSGGGSSRGPARGSKGAVRGPVDKRKWRDAAYFEVITPEL